MLIYCITYVLRRKYSLRWKTGTWKSKQGRSNEEIAILLHLTEEEVDKLLGTEE